MRSLSSGTTEIERSLFDRFITKPAKPAMLINALAEQPQDATEPSIPRAVAGTAGATRGVRVLVADDNAVNQKVAAHMLRKLGADVDCVSNGLEALEALRTREFDLVLMDCQMPEMDGYEATRQLRNADGAHRNRNIPVIALTANALATDREKCIAAGMNDYLTKPIDRARLEQALALANESSENWREQGALRKAANRP